MSSMPPEIPASLRKLMAEVGPVWGSAITQHSKLMADGFSELLATAPKEGSVTRDIAYGAHPRQVLDVYAPRGAANSPVVVFVHGGAFVNGNKDRSSEIYSNVCWYLARHGVLGINMEYRLAPEFKYPCATEDVAAAVAWARKNAGRFGGDPERIFLMGHSAGATHTGCYAYDRRFHPPEGSGIRGFITVSGRVRIETFADNPNATKVKAYFGDDAQLMERGSVVSHVAPDSVPTMIALAQYENPLLDMHGAELFHRLASARRRAPRLVWLAGHNHNSAISHLNTAEDRLGREIIEFIREGW
ncbi:MAG: alpha/beta hydrolase [Betaproteobacteria bacterium]|nr:alpha/beta hydrolase [Betaproteobacteria bacterium]